MKISEQYAAYLRSGIQNAQALIEAFNSNGLRLESELLAAFAQGKTALQIENEWTEKSIAIGLQAPKNPEAGDAWFDPLELSLTVFAPNLEDWVERGGGWFSTHPVRLWQYLGFAKAINFTYVEKTAFPLLQTELFAGKDELANVTNIFSVEAKAYCQWFGKTLTGELVKAVREVMPMEIVEKMMPQGFKLWDQDVAFREDQPLAYNLNTIDYEDGFEHLEKEFSEEDRLIYSEWERHPNIGFATYAEAPGMVYAADAGMLYPYLRSDNVPKRN